jgi:hypothetical protein
MKTHVHKERQPGAVNSEAQPATEPPIIQMSGTQADQTATSGGPDPAPNKIADVLEELVPTDQGPSFDVGEFPLDALHPWMTDLVRQVTDCYQLPNTTLAATLALATVAGAIGKGAYTVGAANGRKTYGNLYALIGAKSGTGKGSCGIIMKPILDVQAEMAQRYAEEEKPQALTDFDIADKRYKNLLGTLTGKAEDGKGKAKNKAEIREEMARLKAEMARLELVKNREPKLTCGGVTGASITEVLLRNDDQTFCYSPEAGDPIRLALGRYQKDQSTDCELLLSGYTVELFQESRVGRGDKTLVPCITVAWMAQPLLLRELIGHPQAGERGLLARFIMVLSEWDVIPYDDGVSREVGDGCYLRWDETIRAMLTLRDGPPCELQCSPEAREVFRSIHNDAVTQRNVLPDDFDANLARWRELAVRIAVGLAVFDAMANRETPRGITPEIAERARRIAEWCMNSTLQILDGGRENRTKERFDKLCDLLSWKGPTTLRDLKRCHGFTEKEIRELARQFPTVEIESQKNPRGGRHSEIVRLVELKR